MQRLCFIKARNLINMYIHSGLLWGNDCMPLLYYCYSLWEPSWLFQSSLRIDISIWNMRTVYHHFSAVDLVLVPCYCFWLHCSNLLEKFFHVALIHQFLALYNENFVHYAAARTFLSLHNRSTGNFNKPVTVGTVSIVCKLGNLFRMNFNTS